MFVTASINALVLNFFFSQLPRGLSVARVHLNQKLVNDLVCPVDKIKQDTSDQICRGLVLEVRRSGGKTYYLRYTNQRGVQRQYRLGSATVLKLAQARYLAKVALNRVAMGQDPCDTKALLKQIPTFAQFIDEQYLPFIKSYKRSWTTDESLLKNHLLPRFGKRYLDEITREDIAKMHAERRASGAAASSANRLLIMMRFIYNLTLKWEVPGITVNPCQSIPLMKENNKRERYLSVKEAGLLYEAVCKSENIMLKYIVPMLMLTGARKSELLKARWIDFDLERRSWCIPMSKSGKPRYIPLSDGALDLLASLHRTEDVPWAFANPVTGKPYVSVHFAWDRARKSVGLSDVRMHDLRHSFASLLINSGRTLYEVQHILGHSMPNTTQRYAHLKQETLLAAANSASLAISEVIRPSIQNESIPD